MRKLILSALLLAAATPVLAQLPPPDVRDEQRDDRGRRGDDQRGDNRGDQRGDMGQRPDDRGPGQRPDDRGGYQGQRPDDRGGYRQDDRGGYRGDDRGYGGDVRRDFRDDRRAYGDGDRFARFHGDPFYYPRGYGYRYYGIGTFLPRVFWSQRYYIADPYAYRLPPAFAGTRWVRVGPDALLIRVYDGRVVRVIQGLFY
jgi:Ni/Co efflux regulator RcnB